MPILQNSLGYTYKSSTKIKRVPKFFKILAFILFFCLIFSGAYYFVFYLPVANIFNLNRNLIFKQTSVYALTMSSFTDYETAQVLAQEIKSQGGAGYILKQDQQFLVLASAYELEDDALSVKTRLKQNSQIETQITPICFNSFVIKLDLNQEQLLNLKTAVNLFFEEFKFLYNLSVQFDSAQITAQETFTSLNNSIENCQTIKNNYNIAFKTIDDYSIVYVKIYLNEIISILKSINSAENLSSQIKYAYFQTLFSYTELINNVGV